MPAAISASPTSPAASYTTSSREPVAWHGAAAIRQRPDSSPFPQVGEGARTRKAIWDESLLWGSAPLIRLVPTLRVGMPGATLGVAAPPRRDARRPGRAFPRG